MRKVAARWWPLELCAVTSRAGWADDPFPTRSADDLDHGWGEGTSGTSDAWADPDGDLDGDLEGDLGRDEGLLRDVPPHHGD